MITKFVIQILKWTGFNLQKNQFAFSLATVGSINRKLVQSIEMWVQSIEMWVQSIEMLVQSKTNWFNPRQIGSIQDKLVQSKKLLD